MFLNVKLFNLYWTDMLLSVDLYHILICVQGSKQIVFVLASTKNKGAPITVLIVPCCPQCVHCADDGDGEQGVRERAQVF